MSRRPFALLALLPVLSLAACGSDDTGNTAASTDGPSRTERNEQTVASACGDATKIAHIMPITEDNDAWSGATTEALLVCEDGRTVTVKIAAP